MRKAVKKNIEPRTIEAPKLTSPRLSVRDFQA